MMSHRADNLTDDAAVNDCGFLFLTEIEELGIDGLRLALAEGLATQRMEPLAIGGAALSGGTRIEITDLSRKFEVLWRSYVAYSIRNESYVSRDPRETYQGKRFRVYFNSHFIDYVARSTYATSDYPGPMQHYEIVCEDHIIDVMSVVAPRIQLIHCENNSEVRRSPRMYETRS